MMNSYVISYDLNTPGQKYSELHELIESNSVAWCKPLSSFYLVKTRLSAEQFSNKIRTVLDDNDLFLVIKCTSDYSGWLDEEQWPYIRNNIF